MSSLLFEARMDKFRVCSINTDNIFLTSLWPNAQIANQIFYSGDQNQSYSGALVYTICEKEGNFILEILGFTSNDFYGNSRIVPIKYCENIDCILSTNTIKYTPSLNYLTEIPIVKATIYPQFTKNFSTYIKKDDIVISVNGKNILEMKGNVQLRYRSSFIFYTLESAFQQMARTKLILLFLRWTRSPTPERGVLMA
jgi:hypothetical protein